MAASQSWWKFCLTWELIVLVGKNTDPTSVTPQLGHNDSIAYTQRDLTKGEFKTCGLGEQFVELKIYSRVADVNCKIREGGG